MLIMLYYNDSPICYYSLVVHITQMGIHPFLLIHIYQGVPSKYDEAYEKGLQDGHDQDSDLSHIAIIDSLQLHLFRCHIFLPRVKTATVTFL